MSNFVGLNTALSGLRASQIGLDTSSHNVANANTTGYTRQRVNLQASIPHGSAVGPLGSGVTVTDIARVRDQFLDTRVRTNLSQSGFHDVRSGLLARTEGMLNEPTAGIANTLEDLWGSLEDLALDPSAGAPRRQVLGALEALSSTVRSVASGWDDLERDTGIQLDSRMAEANKILEELAGLNRTIPQQTFGSAKPNDLLDERDRALDRLAELVGAHATVREDGTSTVMIGGEQVLDGWTATPLRLQGGQVAIGDATAPTVLTTRGEIGAMVDFIVTEMPQRREQLETFVEDFAAALNAQHRSGYDANGNPGVDLLVFDGAVGAARSLRVNPDVAADPRTLAAAGAPGATHDPTNAIALSGLRKKPVMGGDPPQTVNQAYQAIVTDIATGVAAARRSASAQGSLTSSAVVARYGAHGVSLDEEMADVVKYQRSLEAMSRVMSAIDQALDVLINRTGIVGR